MFVAEADVHPEEHRQRETYISSSSIAAAVRRKHSFDSHYDGLSGNAVNSLLRATGSATTPFCGTSPAAIRQLASPYVPSRLLRRIRRQGRVYNVRWSPSGRLLASATQDDSIELHAEGRWTSPIAHIEAQDVAWAVTSVDMTEDDALLAYSSMQSTVHLVDIRRVAAQASGSGSGGGDDAGAPSRGGSGGSGAGSGDAGGRRATRSSSASAAASFTAAAAGASAAVAAASASAPGADLIGTHVPLDFSAPAGVSASSSGIGTGAGGGGRRRRAWDGGFPIYQLRFSAGGSEIIAACGDHCVVVWDVERERVAERIPAHDDDINTVAFVDGAHRPHLLATGSDDCLIKIWDRRAPPAVSSSSSADAAAGSGDAGSSGGVATRARRSSGAGNQRPAGYLAGHMGGLTSIASRCDGRYLASNGKDMCAKLWDVRRATAAAPRSYRPYPYDYRMRRYVSDGTQLTMLFALLALLLRRPSDSLHSPFPLTLPLPPFTPAARHQPAAGVAPLRRLHPHHARPQRARDADPVRVEPPGEHGPALPVLGGLRRRRVHLGHRQRRPRPQHPLQHGRRRGRLGADGRRAGRHVAPDAAADCSGVLRRRRCPAQLRRGRGAGAVHGSGRAQGRFRSPHSGGAPRARSPSDAARGAEGPSCAGAGCQQPHERRGGGAKAARRGGAGSRKRQRP